jgi:hypothetical protein
LGAVKRRAGSIGWPGAHHAGATLGPASVHVVAARAGPAGKEFAVVAGVLSNITTEIDEMVSRTLNNALKAA